MLAHCGGDAARWRPHLKTTKMAPVYDACVASGVRHFKCATVKEARLMCGVLRGRAITDGDVLLAYPLIGPSLKQLADEFPEVRLGVLCEDAAAAPRLPGSLGVFIDINPGYDRTGVPFEATDDICRHRDGCWSSLPWAALLRAGVASERRFSADSSYVRPIVLRSKAHTGACTMGLRAVRVRDRAWHI